MRILCVTQRYFPVIGGSEILAKNFMDYMSKKHQIFVYTSNADDVQSFWNKNASKISNFTSYDYPIVRYEILTPSEIKFDDDNLLKLPLILNYPGPFLPDMWKDLITTKIDFDLIFTTAYPYDHIIPAYVASKKWKIPLIVLPLMHEEFPELYSTGLRLTMLSNSDAIVVLSESEKKNLVDRGIDEQKISVIYPMINKDEWNNPDPDKFRKTLSINPTTKIVLFAGSKAFSKGIIHLIDAMKIVWSKNYNIMLVLLGPSTKEYEEYFSKLPTSIKKKITDLGVVDAETKKNAFTACNLLALPSKSESFGLVYLEAWLCEKPVIGCKMDATSEVIDDMKNGILVRFGNVKEISTAITYLIDNPDISESYGKNGKNKLSKYVSQNSFEKFEKLCNMMVENFKNNIRE